MKGAPLRVYWKNQHGSLAQMDVESDDHEEAIIATKETLVDVGEGYNDPVLAVIEGGPRVQG
jgi:hypothetical protein